MLKYLLFYIKNYAKFGLNKSVKKTRKLRTSSQDTSWGPVFRVITKGDKTSIQAITHMEDAERENLLYSNYGEHKNKENRKEETNKKELNMNLLKIVMPMLIVTAFTAFVRQQVNIFIQCQKIKNYVIKYELNNFYLFISANKRG